ncbi:MAG: protease inhibitor I42 family protein [Spirochaetes bacterium]|nr:protease inhibitor I42 family protein [Spirochaetota bacterium]
MVDMMKYGICVAAVSVLAFFMSCASGPSVTITEGDNGKTIAVSRGDLFEVRLKAQLGTGYGWQQKSASDLIEVKGTPTQAATVEMAKEMDKDKGKDKVETGGFEFQVFTYRALKSGRGEISFEYRQPWNKRARALKTYRVSLEIR